MENVQQYRAKPVSVYALRYDGSNHNKVMAWIGKSGGSADYDADNDTIKLLSPEGTTVVNHGDYVIQDVQGDFRSLTPEIFKQKYEAR